MGTEVAAVAKHWQIDEVANARRHHYMLAYLNGPWVNIQSQ